MDTKSYKLDSLNKGWLLVDASDKTLGRLSTNIAKILMGKNKLSNSVIKKLKVYKGESHPHSAQNPVKLEI